MARILITTFGSYGDLHPYIAVALGLKQRGHEPVIATSASYRSKVEAEDLRFHPVRPDLDDFGPFADVARRVYDPKRGAEYLLRELVLPRLADTYDDLAVAMQGADLLVTHALTYAAHLLRARHRRALGIDYPLADGVHVGLRPATSSAGALAQIAAPYEPGAVPHGFLRA